jgi:Na+/H+ antiporter NhaC
MKESEPYWRKLKHWVYFALSGIIICGVFANLPTNSPASLEDKIVGHWTSILPPLLAVSVAIFFRTLVWALTSAFLIGAFLAFGPLPWVAIPSAVDQFIWTNLTTQFNIYIFGFLFALVGLIHVTYKSGGIDGLVAIFSRFAKSRRSTKITTMLAGLVIFFDDYSNTIVVGSTMRKLTDKWRISREKLAYIVDSTTAPVAGLALISTWIGFEVWLLGETARDLGMDVGGYTIFLKLIPLRFYCWGTLIFILLNSLMERDYGPMYRAENRAAVEGKLLDDDAHLLIRDGFDNEPAPEVPRRWINAALPLFVVIGGIFIGVLVVGRNQLLATGENYSLFLLSEWDRFIAAAAQSGEGTISVLFWSSAAGGVIAIALARCQNILTIKESLQAFFKSIKTLRLAIFIIVMAWAMKTIGQTLGTDTYLISLLDDRLPLWLLPLCTFVLAGVISFSTGSSWATMGILIPVILPLIYSMESSAHSGNVLFFLAAAAVLDGAIFGDHCSPISDTTILSSFSSACDHLDHVATQLPYALTTMIIASILGYIFVGLGASNWTFFILFPITAFLFLRVVGKKVVREA